MKYEVVVHTSSFIFHNYISLVEVIFIGLSVALASLVAKIAMQIIEQRRCLKEETITEFMKQRIDKDDPEYSRIIGHLGICEKCQQRVQEFSFNTKIEDHLIDRNEKS